MLVHLICGYLHGILEIYCQDRCVQFIIQQAILQQDKYLPIGKRIAVDVSLIREPIYLLLFSTIQLSSSQTNNLASFLYLSTGNYSQDQ